MVLRMEQNSIFREIYLLKTEAGKYWVGLLASSKCQITCTLLLASSKKRKQFKMHPEAARSAEWDNSFSFIMPRQYIYSKYVSNKAIMGGINIQLINNEHDIPPYILQLILTGAKSFCFTLQSFDTLEYCF